MPGDNCILNLKWFAGAKYLRGVYFLFYEDFSLMYVGQSDDCTTRIAQHKKHGRHFDHALILPIMDNDLAKVVESALQTRLRPL
jgi:hypothetical protein